MREKRGTERETSKAESKVTQASAGAEPTYFFGWDNEIMKAWRQLPDAKNATREVCMILDVNGKDGDPVVGIWADNSSHRMPEMTCGRYRSLTGSRRVNKSLLWEGETHDSHHALGLTQRPDRDPAPMLLSLHEQSKQILQVCRSLIWGFQ